MKPLSSTRTRAARPARLTRIDGRAVPLALCAVVLAACGSERRSGEQEGKDGAGSRSVAARTPSEGPEFIEFMELLDSVEEPCVPQAPATVAPEPSEPGRPRTAPTPLPTLPSTPPAPDATGPREPPCGSGTERRREVRGPRPHPPDHRRPGEDARSHPGPGRGSVARPRLPRRARRRSRRSAGRVGFTLDLRIMGGHLCLDGTVTGARTAVLPYGASPRGTCREVRRSAPGVTSSRA